MASREQIEEEARSLQRLIWKERDFYWPGRTPHPLEMLDPEVGASVLGIGFQYVPELSFGIASGKWEAAGLLNRTLGRIAVSQRWGIEVARFTAGHELGHWILP